MHLRTSLFDCSSQSSRPVILNPACPTRPASTTNTRVVCAQSNNSSNIQREALEALFRLDIPHKEEQYEGKQGRAISFAHPHIDWSLYYIQILFVGRDEADPRARLACAIFERISSWNGFGRAIYETNCDLALCNRNDLEDFKEQSRDQSAESASREVYSSSAQRSEGTPFGSGASASTSNLDSAASILSRAYSLKLDTKLVAQKPNVFEVDDLDCNHLVLCMDEGIREGVLNTVPLPYRKAYEEKVVVLTSFSAYESDATFAQRGGFALLPQQLSALLVPGLARAKQATHVPAPAEDWLTAIQVLVLSTACLAKYLIDAHPEDHWDDA